MDVLAYLREAGEKHGPSGQEREVAAWLGERFRPFVDSVEIDPLFNVIAVKKGGTGTADAARPPKIMLCAHQDEIALMVTQILPDGTLRMGQVGGVDPRILPAATVVVHATPEGEPPQKLPGVVGAKPPHLLPVAERKQNDRLEDLFVDLGLPPEDVEKRVHIGDLITLQGEAQALLNGRVAGKTMDDWACVGVMLDVAQRLQSMRHEAEVVFVCSSQEEVGGRGAQTAAHRVDPDLAVVLDVSHAPVPQSRPDTTIPLDAPAAAYGPYMQHKLLKRLRDTAARHHVKLNSEAMERATHTDADGVQVAREGVPCVLLGLPLKYMHTTVELLDMDALTECGRLLAHFIAELSKGWEEGLWN